jgi:hypothetical protein
MRARLLCKKRPTFRIAGSGEPPRIGITPEAVTVGGAVAGRPARVSYSASTLRVYFREQIVRGA